MKYFVYAVLALIAGFLFLPATGTSEIRNQPLLILILSLILISILIRFLKYVALTVKTKQSLKQKKIAMIKSNFQPWASSFHGHYSITFQYENQTVQIVLLSKKRKYQRYHFDRIDRLEFYRANRVIFRSSRIRGATISNLVETNQVGKQRIKWDNSAKIRVILFDKLPDQITDSVKKENLGTGDQICASDVYILDHTMFCKHLGLTK